jgi:xanthine/uracil permease
VSPRKAVTDASGGGRRGGGLQPERTALSWQRTALSTALVSLLLAFACLKGGFLIGTAIAAAVAVGAVLVLFAGRHRTARRENTSPWTPLTRMTLLIVATAALGAVLALLILT